MVLVSCLVLTKGPIQAVERKFWNYLGTRERFSQLSNSRIAEHVTAPCFPRRAARARRALPGENTDEGNLGRLSGNRIVHIVAQIECFGWIAPAIQDFQEAFRERAWAVSTSSTVTIA